jgi:hypothetical protein
MPKLLTIGYEAATLADLIGRLKGAGVQVVINERGTDRRA